MRNAFIRSLVSNADERTHLLVGDLGYSVVEAFAERFPNQFLNVGIAEQAMVGLAAGLAMEGARVFVYSIANFDTLRPLEQIRNDVCYHNLDVTVVSVGGGFVYGSAGYSHHAVQDVGIMAALPHMNLLLPSSARETEYCMGYAFAHSGPKYLRIGKNDDGRDVNVPFAKIRAFGVNNTPLALVTSGGMLDVALDVQSMLLAAGIPIVVYSCPIIDNEFSSSLRSAVAERKHRAVFSLEEGIATCGFGSLVRDALEGGFVETCCFGAQRDLVSIVGDQSFMRKAHGIDKASVVARIMEFAHVRGM